MSTVRLPARRSSSCSCRSRPDRRTGRARRRAAGTPGRWRRRSARAPVRVAGRRRRRGAGPIERASHRVAPGLQQGDPPCAPSGRRRRGAVEAQVEVLAGHHLGAQRREHSPGASQAAAGDGAASRSWSAQTKARSPARIAALSPNHSASPASCSAACAPANPRVRLVGRAAATATGPSRRRGGGRRCAASRRRRRRGRRRVVGRPPVARWPQ